MGAAHDSEVFLNGEKVGEHHCGYTAFTMDIMEYSLEKKISFAMKVDSREDLNIPPFGYVIDYMTYGGFTGMSIWILKIKTTSKIFLSGQTLDKWMTRMRKSSLR